MQNVYDVAIIGLGPAGLEAASIAIKNNLNVIIFEKEAIGGTCLNKGCIPTKTILHSANLYNDMKNCAEAGLSCKDPSFDFGKIISRKDEIIKKFNNLLELNIEKKAKIIKDEAAVIIDNDEIIIEAKDNIYQAKNIIIATGSKPNELPDLKFDHKSILSSDDILDLKELPKSIAIVGSGAIGLEIAQFLKSFELDVTIVEYAPSLAPSMDIDIQKRVERILKKQGINYFKNDFIVEFNNGTVKLNSSKTFEAQKILVAAGRKPVLPEIRLSQSPSRVELKINPDCTCDFDNLYITGDATQHTMLAHSASYQAKMVMNRILGKKELNIKPCPAVIYLTPEIASVGLKEQDIENKNDYIIKKMMLTALMKPWCENKADGVIKVIIKDNKIKGAHIVSANASILISIFNILIEKEITLDEIDEFIFPHPCYSEVVQGVLK